MGVWLRYIEILLGLDIELRIMVIQWSLDLNQQELLREN
jgi:hypothetical protein